MDFDFRSLIDLSFHEQQLTNKQIDLKNKYISLNLGTQRYLDALSDLFLDDIKLISQTIYDEALIKNENHEIKLTSAKDLCKCFEEAAKHFSSIYISNLHNYNIGMMLGCNFSNAQLQNLIVNFNMQLEKKIQQYIKLIASKYANEKKNRRENKIMLTGTVIAAIAAAIAACPIIISALKVLLIFSGSVLKKIPFFT